MTDNQPPYIPLSVPDYAAMRDEEKPHLLLDVREPYEFEEAHIPSAVLIPMNDVLMRMNELQGHDSIVVVCRSGSRSAMVAMALRDNGMTNTLYNLEGGIMSWVRAGHEYAQGDE
jgi:rhodanese-related sulfurtransferase